MSSARRTFSKARRGRWPRHLPAHEEASVQAGRIAVAATGRASRPAPRVCAVQGFHSGQTLLGYEDVAKGTLPTYSFIEPNLLHGHNDMHPPFAMLMPGLEFDPPSSLLGGEALLARIYNAIRSSSSRGSNCFNSLLLITFDEHGGTYDHVAPPAATPPDPAGPARQMGFTFDRLGVRVPAIAISPWISAQMVVNDPYRHTSVIRTLRDRWNLGRALTARDADAPI